MSETSPFFLSNPPLWLENNRNDDAVPSQPLSPDYLESISSAEINHIALDFAERIVNFCERHGLDPHHLYSNLLILLTQPHQLEDRNHQRLGFILRSQLLLCIYADYIYQEIPFEGVPASEIDRDIWLLGMRVSQVLASANPASEELRTPQEDPQRLHSEDSR